MYKSDIFRTVVLLAGTESSDLNQCFYRHSWLSRFEEPVIVSIRDSPKMLMSVQVPSHRTVASYAERMGDDASMSEMMHEVRLAMATDSLVVAWHAHGGERSIVLFAEGADAELSATTPAFFVGSHDGGTRSERSASDARDDGELTTSIETSAGIVTITGRFDRPGATARAHARAMVANLLPMVRPFLRLWAERVKALAQVRGLTAAVNKSDVGILLVNGLGQLLFANAAAEVLLAEHDGIRRQGRLLSGARLQDTLRLQAAIEQAITSEDGRGPPVVALTRMNRRPLLAAVVPNEAGADQAGDSAAIVFLCDPDQDLTPLVASTCRLYNLSPVETRLTCHLARGVSLSDAADAMHVREQTARSYLKQIFLKTETRRQAELVWLMLKSSVRTLSARHVQVT